MELKKNSLRLRQVLPCLLILLVSFSELKAQFIEPAISTRRTLPEAWFGWDLAPTNRGDVSCVNTFLMSRLPQLYPKTLRFPGADFANWYDWKTGWYKDTIVLPEKYLSLDQVPNKLEDFKGLLDLTGAEAVLDLNLLTATLQDQIAMLKHADSIGIPIKYIELGEEYYLNGNEGEDTALIMSTYPTVQDYGHAAKKWIDTIHAYFPNAKVAVQGCFDSNKAPRRVTWNAGILETVNNADAWTFHYYYNSNFYDPEETEAEKLDVNMNEMPIMLYQPFAAWDIMSNVSLPKVPAGKEAWITEYNLLDFTRPTHGMWFSGLFEALQTLMLLDDERVQIVNPHAVAGEAVYGAFFFDDDGFTFGAQGNFVPPVIQPATTFWGKSAGGYSMSLLGETMNQMQYAAQITFEGTRILSAYDRNKDETNYYEALYGWLFTNDDESRAYIINVGDSDQIITTTDIFPSGGTYQMLKAPVLSLIATAADMTITNGNLPNHFTIPPYSIVRITSDTVPAPPPPPAAITVNGPMILCEGDSVQLDAGAGYNHYLWSTGETSRKIWAREDSDYWVEAYPSAFGYCATDTVHIVVNENPAIPNIVPGGNKKFCSGGTIELSLDSDYNATGLSFYWPLTGATTPSITTGLDGGHYLLVTNGNGCTSSSDTEVITVMPLPQPVITAQGPTSACYDIGVTLKAPTGYGQYIWSNGTTGDTKLFTTSGTYYCSVKDANNCWGNSNSMSVTVWEPPLPTITASGPTTFCLEAAVYLTTLPGYQYQWQKGGVVMTGETNQNYYPGSSSNTIKVEITDDHGCKKKSNNYSVTVNVLNPPLITATGGTSICVGATTNLSVPSGYGSYLWSTGATTNSINVSSTGNYTCALVDQNGCTAVTSPKSITVNPLPTPNITAAGPTSFCDGGSVDLAATSGYNQYTWSNGKLGPTINSNSSETVTVTVKDANNCYGTSSSITVTEWIVPVPTISANGPLTFCSETPTTLSTLAGYSYQWFRSGIAISGATNQTYVPTLNGNHKVTITDSHQCSATSGNIQITINTAATPTISGNLGICPASSTTLTASSGYNSYLWSSGQTTGSVSISNPGNYYVTGTDANGCKATSVTKTVTNSPAPSPVISAGGATSFCDGGSVLLDAGTYSSYNWSNGKTTQTNSVTTSGNYTITVTNSYGCSGTSAPVAVTVWTVPVPVVSIGGGGSSPTYCSNSGNYLTAIAGYSYQWYKGTNPIAGGTNQNYTPAAGTSNYKVKISDSHGCSQTSANLNVTVNAAPTPVISGSGTICQGSSTILSVGSYSSYVWSTGATTATINVNSAGTYSVTVTDTKGCTATSPSKTTTVVPLPTPVISAGGATSFCDGGSVLLDAGTYSSYNWSNGKTTQTNSVTTSGNYTITVTNSYGCSGTSAPVAVTVWTVPVPVVSIGGGGSSPTYCSNSGNYLTTIAGYNYQWYKGTNPVTGATNQNYSPAAVTSNYKVQISDSHGCSQTSASLNVTVNAAPTPVISGSTNICQGSSTTLSVGSYSSYTWSTGVHTATINVNSAGTYSVTVTDTKGCTATSPSKTTTVVPLPTPVISAGGATSFCDGGSVLLDAGTYSSYNWSNGKTTQTNSVTTSGNYTITVTNSYGCSGTSAPVAVTVWTVPVPVVSIGGGGSSPTYCSNSGNYLTTIAGYSYQWYKGANPVAGATNQNYSPAVGTSGYKVQISDSHGCSQTSASLNVTVNAAPTPVISGSTNICQGSSTTLSVGSYSSYTWSTGVHTATINVNSAGTYSVTVTDTKGCTATSPSKTTTVVPLPTPVISAGGATSFCDGGSVTLDAGSGYSTYSWSNGKNLQSVVATASGTFTVTVTNSSGCSGTSSPVTVTEWVVPDPSVSAVGPTTYCAGGSTYLTTLAGYTYQWIKGSVNVDGATNQTYTPTAGATYKVTITDNHSCSLTSSVGLKITINSNPSASISATGSLNICAGQTKTINANGGTGLTYQWKKNGNNISGATIISYVATTAADYQCVVSNISGCTTLSNTITITSNGCKEGEAKDDIENSVIWQLFPNPAYDVLHVRLTVNDEKSEDYSLEVRNLLGQTMLRDEGLFTEYKISADIRLSNELPEGIYFVIVRYGDKMYNSQFVITRP